jgi:membrane-associated phospholipid phosphatase
MIVLAWIAAGLVCLPLDATLARWCIDGGFPGEIRAVFARCESFGHGYGVLAILVTIYVLDPARRGGLGGLAACYLAGGMSANLLKLQVWRVRPRVWIEGSVVDADTWIGSLWTDHDWHWTELWRHEFQSFPSAHTAGAVAFAVGLGRMYPAGRRWFFVLAALCAMNRIDGGAHFASDVCWGTGLGYCLGTLVSAWSWQVAWPLPWAATMRREWALFATRDA